jgi:lipoprotein-anchoring transpeptidase ErfK/SrfK
MDAVTPRMVSLRYIGPSLGFSLRRLLLAATLALCAGTPAARAAEVATDLKSNLSWQLALERAHFSPGVIDGKIGPKTQLATREFQRVRGLPQSGELDKATSAALQVGGNPLTVYTIAAEDTADIGEIPTGWEDRSKLKRMRYESLADLVAERFHCTQELLARLNPDKKLDALKCRDRLIVPAVDQAPAAPATTPAGAVVLIDIDAKVIRVLDRERRLVALLHCSIAKDKEKVPKGDARIVSITYEPKYSFDPAMWPEVKDVNRKLLIPEGPRSPVGLCWIGLSREGYGIHGTPKPELIGKTGSHGCFRLTNWDAMQLAQMVREGVPVKFVTSEPAVASAE